MERRWKDDNIILAASIAFILLLFLVASMAGRGGRAEGVTGEEASAMLGFTCYSQEEWRELLGQKASKQITWNDVDFILDTLGLSGYISGSGGSPGQAVQRGEWFAVYDKILDILDTEGRVRMVDTFLLGTPSEVAGLAEGEVLTSEGVFSCGSLISPDTMFARGSFVVIDNVLTIRREAFKGEQVLQNVWVLACNGDELSFVAGNHNISIPRERLEGAGVKKQGDFSDSLCDLSFVEGQLTEVSRHDQAITGTCESMDGGQLHLAGREPLELGEQFRVYRKEGGNVTQADPSDLADGQIPGLFVVEGNQALAAILTPPVAISDIRVLLRNGEEMLHPSVTVDSEAMYKICRGDQEAFYAAGETVEITPAFFQGEEAMLRILPAEEGGKIRILSLEKNGQYPAYRGAIEVRREEGGLLLVNELPLESYLYSVLPSEMPASFGLEALKAQAVCARSFAYRQMQGGAGLAGQAHVDDSTASQVYNQFGETDLSIQAVDETRGVVAVCGGQVIDAYYFSTSCGATSNIEVWGAKVSSDFPYLQAKAVWKEAPDRDLTQEEAFAAFIQDRETPSYDREGKWYRWEAELDIQGCAQAINGEIEALRAVRPEHVFVLSEQGEYESGTPVAYGDIISIRVGERKPGGAVSALIVEEAGATIQITSEFNIRKILGAAMYRLVLKDGTDVSSMAMLPSAYFTLNPLGENGVVEQLILSGGGFGHGVGMSQNGASVMAAEGKTYEEILQFFYAGIELTDIYAAGKDGAK